MPIDFKFPLNCLPGIGEVWAGDYDISIGVEGPVTILDIGANCGAFSARCMAMWPQAKITAYEPNPETFRYLYENCSPLGVECIQAAVGDPSNRFYRNGNDSPLCGSLEDVGEQAESGFEVAVVEPRSLPHAEIVKIDTEGSEAYIVERLGFTPDILLLEWHSDVRRARIEHALSGRMKLFGSKQYGLNRGVLKYASYSIMPGNFKDPDFTTEAPPLT